MAKLYLFLAIYHLYHKENSGKFESVSIDFEIQLDSWEVPWNCIVCRYKTIRAVCNLVAKHKLMMIVVVLHLVIFQLSRQKPLVDFAKAGDQITKGLNNGKKRWSSTHWGIEPGLAMHKSPIPPTGPYLPLSRQA